MTTPPPNRKGLDDTDLVIRAALAAYTGLLARGWDAADVEEHVCETVGDLAARAWEYGVVFAGRRPECV
jgi:hypothetical protein